MSMRVAVRVWAVVDMDYRPKPIVVESGANREWIMRDCRERNEHQKGRYKVVSCHGGTPAPPVAPGLLAAARTALDRADRDPTIQAEIDRVAQCERLTGEDYGTIVRADAAAPGHAEPRFKTEGGRIYDREWSLPGYVIKVWATRHDGRGLADAGPEVEAQAQRLCAMLNAEPVTEAELLAFGEIAVRSGWDANDKAHADYHAATRDIAARALSRWRAERSAR